MDTSAAQSSEQTLYEQAHAAFRARAIAVSRARNEKVVADNFFEAGNLEQAAKLYLHALAVAPDAFYYDEKKLIATRLASANHKSDAVAILEDLRTERSNDVQATLEITKLLDTLQPHSLSVAEADAVLRQDGRNKYALLIKADALRQRKQFPESMVLYRRILQQGNDFDARLGLIYSLLAVGEKSLARQEFKLIDTQDETQEEQYYELASVLDASTRPSVDLLQNHYKDTDKNRSVENGAIVKVVVGDLDWVADVRKKTAVSPDVATAYANTYSLGATTNVTDRVRVTGKYGLAELITDQRTSLISTGQLKADVKTGSGVLSGNVSWDALNATTASIKSTTRVAKKSIELTQPLTDRLRADLAYAYNNYSDGNAANDLRASANFVLYQGLPQISLGYGFHRMNYKNPLIPGSSGQAYSYSTPQDLVANQTMLTVYYESERFYANADIEFGSETYNKNGDPIKDSFHYYVGTVGFKATRKLSLELNAEYSKGAIAEAADTYNESVLGARISYLF